VTSRSSTSLLADFGPAPEFALQSTDGRLETLPSGPTLLVFIRGHWCPYCRRYLGKLQQIADAVTQRGVTILTISPEPVETSGELVRELKLSFPILADVEGDVINRYKVRNRFAGSATRLPHPSVLLIDASGTIRFRAIDRDYKRRTTIRTIQNVVAELMG
jgi:peroxiredoxin